MPFHKLVSHVAIFFGEFYGRPLPVFEWSHLFVVELQEFFIHSACLFLIRYVVCEYPLPFYELSFDSLDVLFSHFTGSLYLDFVLLLCFNIIFKKLLL